jgi:DNA-binding protein H-NS
MEHMSIDELIELREKADSLIRQRLAAEKEQLLQKLDAIHRYESKANLPARSSTGAARARATPKYRNPTTGDTWAGRGQQPRWLRQAIEAGHKLDEFLIK